MIRVHVNNGTIDTKILDTNCTNVLSDLKVVLTHFQNIVGGGGGVLKRNKAIAT